ncbi:hypothetical protein EP7_005569 (plasmid) [Isosphaeraceae bacterium EP7]
MITFAPALASVKPAARVLFYSAEFYNYALDFGTDLQPPRMTLVEELAHWDSQDLADFAAGRLDHRGRA